MTAERQTIRFTTGADGVRLAYAMSGSGPPVVKTPTWITHLEYDWKSPVSRHWLAELNRDHCLLRYDARGTGLSDWNVADISFEAWVADLESVIEAVQFRRFTLTGTSQGAAVAIAYAARHPERVSRLVLWGSFCRGLLKRGDSPHSREKADLLVRLAEMGWGTDEPAFCQVFTSQFIPGGTPEQWRWFSEKMRVSTSAENAARFMRVVQEIDIRGLAQQVRCPTLVIHSRNDARIPYEEGKLTAALIRGSEFVTLDSANHVVLEGEPAWVQLIAELRRFLGASPTDSAGAGDGQRAPRFAALTERERQVVDMLARGLDNQEIATQLFLSPKTVRNHVSNIFGKIEVNSRPQAIVAAREAGFGRWAK